MFHFCLSVGQLVVINPPIHWFCLSLFLFFFLFCNLSDIKNTQFTLMMMGMTYNIAVLLLLLPIRCRWWAYIYTFIIICPLIWLLENLIIRTFESWFVFENGSLFVCLFFYRSFECLMPSVGLSFLSLCLSVCLSFCLSDCDVELNCDNEYR